MRRAADLWEADGGIPVEINAAGTATLAQQIRWADIADLFLSADRDWIERLQASGHLAPESTDLWSNRLVVVTRRGALPLLHTPADLADSSVRHVATGDPGAVPVGRYARRILERTPPAPSSPGDLHHGEALSERADSLWAQIEARIVPTTDVRAALALAAASPRLAAIVYASDVESARPEIEYRFDLAAGVVSGVPADPDAPPEPGMPADVLPDVTSVGAVTTTSRVPASAAEFLVFLTEPRVRALAEDMGFSAPRSPRASLR